MKRGPVEHDELLTPGDVARMFRVDIKTVARWDKAGKFPPGSVIRTVGGVRRFRADVVRELLAGGEPRG